MGEVTLVLLTTVAQEVLFDGITFRASSISDLLWGGTATNLAAVISGCVASLVAKEKYIIVPIVVSLFIVADTSYIILKNITGDPVWFDILAGTGLVFGVWLGYFLVHFIKSNRSKQSLKSRYSN